MDDVSPTGPTPPTEPASPAMSAARHRRRWLLGVLTLLFLLCGAAYGAYWAFIDRFEESTDDAYVAGNVVPITTRVNGTVIAIRADNTQLVQEGQPLVLLDSTDARITLEHSEAQLAQSVRRVQALYQTAAQQEANVALQRAKLAQSRIDYRRDSNLLKRKYVSTQDYQHIGTQVDVDQAGLALAEHQLSATQAAVANTVLADHPEVRLAAANLRDAYVALQRTTIRAPVTGYVDKRSIQVGARVAAGAVMMAVIPLDEIWVEANFKESQLRNVRIGQSVSLTSDLYGSHVAYRGRVLGVGAGTGSAFAVLPPQNATGNWIKVVQRIPVRIGLDPAEVSGNPLRIGSSMTAVIDTHDRRGTALRDSPMRRDYVTRVYRDEDKGADALIDRIIRENTVTMLPTAVTTSPVTGPAGTAATRRVQTGGRAATAKMTAGLPRATQADPSSHD